MYHIAALIIHDTAVTDRVATACLQGLEATLRGEHSLQVRSGKGNRCPDELKLY